MNGYLFIAGIAVIDTIQVKNKYDQEHPEARKYDSVTGIIVCGDSPEEAQKSFEAWVMLPRENDTTIEKRILKIAPRNLWISCSLNQARRRWTGRELPLMPGRPGERKLWLQTSLNRVIGWMLTKPFPSGCPAWTWGRSNAAYRKMSGRD